MRDPLVPFEALYRASPDPWGTSTRWYESRKRSLLLAALPLSRYGSIYEAGCGTGHITTALAERCDLLLASDGSAEAHAIASQALAHRPHVQVALHRLPEDWPARLFDLVVLSELLYFLDTDECVAVAVAVRASVDEGGTVIACNWRHPIEGHGHTGDDVHRRFESALDLPKIFEYVDADFLLGGWSKADTSVAQREGLRP